MFGKRLRQANAIARRRYDKLGVALWSFPQGRGNEYRVGHFRKWNMAHGCCSACSWCYQAYKRKGQRKDRTKLIYRLYPETFSTKVR